MNYRIKYNYGALTDKEIIVKNVSNEMHAKIALNDRLVKRYGQGRLVIYSCNVETVIGDFGALNDLFGGIFK